MKDRVSPENVKPKQTIDEQQLCDHSPGNTSQQLLFIRAGERWAGNVLLTWVLLGF